MLFTTASLTYDEEIDRTTQTCTYLPVELSRTGPGHTIPPLVHISATMRHPSYIVLSLLAALTVALPASWHWRANNIATLSIIFWLFSANLVVAVNAIIWSDNYNDWSPVWCDISGRVVLAAGIAIPICCLSQMHKLEAVASTRTAGISQTKNNRRRAWDVILCLGFPVVHVALRYIVQGHRYDLAENIGCVIPFWFTWPGLIIVNLVPLVICIAALVYAILALRWFLIRRMQFTALLQASSGGLTTGRYLRLISLTLVDVTIVIFGAIYQLVIRFKTDELSPYGSWREAHQDFGQIQQYSEDFNIDVASNAMTLYLLPLYSFVFFIFFGFGEEAIREYLLFGRAIVRWYNRLLIRRPAPNATVQADFTLGTRVAHGATHSDKPNSDPVGTRWDDSHVACADSQEEMGSFGKIVGAKKRLDVGLSTEVTVV
ncbi:hypothetical protein NliqN6_1002 [Naganishia liquefaciens]|uniref:Uncharacterized protein n=1 Tax=Naganishia liquefaciens TaxID=104408 RepID=A0A8H3TQ90_9TREE|nr:hypothetical protein NliqN6_1002 [Naganishia liquefaciens]